MDSVTRFSVGRMVCQEYLLYIHRSSPGNIYLVIFPFISSILIQAVCFSPSVWFWGLVDSLVKLFSSGSETCEVRSPDLEIASFPGGMPLPLRFGIPYPIALDLDWASSSHFLHFFPSCLAAMCLDSHSVPLFTLQVSLWPPSITVFIGLLRCIATADFRCLPSSASTCLPLNQTRQSPSWCPTCHVRLT